MQIIKPARPNLYSGGRLDRAAHLREAPAFLDAALGHPQSRFTYSWRGKSLLAAGPQPAIHWRASAGMDTPWLFLGLLDEVCLFAQDLSAWEELPDLGAGSFQELRDVAACLDDTDAAILATARGMFHWRATHRFCPACGGEMAPIRAGWVLQCKGCGREHFPRTDAAVIMLVTCGDEALLGQSHRFPPERNYYSALAGFVEPGEALEDAVRREVAEEVGVRVGEVTYHSSQPWPFPASLMLGYYAQALSRDIVLQADEMRDAKWFSRAQIRARAEFGFNLPPEVSIARRLIDDWLDGEPG